MSALVGVGGFFVFIFGVLSFFFYFKKPEKRKNSKYIVLAGIVLFIVGLMIPSPEPQPEDSVAIAQEEASSEIILNDPESEVVEETAPVEVESFSIGEEVTVGDVSYVVNGVSSAETLGGEYLNKTAQGIFLVVNVTVINKGNESLDVSNTFFTLVDGEKQYDSDSAASLYANESGQSFFVNSINPDLSLTSNVAFDVTQAIVDSQTKQLQVQTGVWGTEKGLINLQ
nr:DUF4352 domain-containing protein [uncultured Trichococcus sp.]